MRRVSAQHADPSAMLLELRRTRRNRTIARIATAVVVVGAAAGATVAVSGSGEQHANRPGHSTAVHRTSDRPTVVHLGGNRYRITLPVPVTLRVPANFGRGFNLTRTAFDAYRSDVDQTGVSILEHAIPVKNAPLWVRDPSAGTTAASVARWLSHRPFLTHTEVTRGRVDGHDAWRVTGALKPGARLRAHKTLLPTAPVFRGVAPRIGYQAGVRSQFTLLDLPRVGLTVIWSWTYERPQTLQANAGFISGISFG
jgi:hypothetical protein